MIFFRVNGLEVNTADQGFDGVSFSACREWTEAVSWPFVVVRVERRRPVILSQRSTSARSLIKHLQSASESGGKRPGTISTMHDSN